MIKRKCIKQTLLLLLCMLLVPAGWAGAVVEEQRRLQVGLSLFPNIISVDQDIISKQTVDGKVHLLLVYEHDRDEAAALLAKLSRRAKKIGRVEIQLDIVDYKDIDQKRYADLAAVFLTEKMSEEAFRDINNFAILSKRILFSVFTGDVERGAGVGLHISSKVLPYYNAATLTISEIKFHPVFLKVAKRYGQ